MLQALSLARGAARRAVMASVVLVALFAGTRAMGQPYWFGYEPSLGTLPDDQCWELVQNGTHPAPVVTGGVMQIGTTTTSGTQYWSRVFNEEVDFTRGAVMEMRLEVIASNYNATSGGSGQRAGFYFSVADKNGRRFNVGIAANKLLIATSDPTPVGAANPSIDFVTTGQVRTYRLEVLGTTARLYVDNELKLTATQGQLSSIANRAYFGDGSIYGTSKVLVHSARVLVQNKPCYSDFNRDCFLDFLDFDDFVEAFQDGLEIADFNGDGFLDFQDFDAFVTDFEAGC